MTLTSMGRVNQPHPGTPVALSTDPTQRASKIYIQVIPGLSGKAFIGSPAMNSSTLAGVTGILAPNPDGDTSDRLFIESSDGTDSLVVSQYAIDMEIANEGVLVSYWTA